MANPVAEYVADILSSPATAPLISYHKIMAAVPADYGVSRQPWSGAIQKLLSEHNIRLYSHQSLAMDHIRAGHAIVAATPTASGKSLIYNLPVFEQHLRDPDARALYLFPLKALAQDQQATFNALAQGWPVAARPGVAIYDGDTPEAERRQIRADPPTALITNPDMLHQGILPWHANWSVFFANLSHIVVDEAHIYRGLFGCHMAQIFRRLNRVAAHYGSRPSYIFCTATLGNPAELAARLMGTAETPILIDKSGAPQGKRHFIFINPEQASSTAAIELLKKALARELRVIVYCQSRRMTELISLWAAEDGEWQGKIAAYRSGYLPGERRQIEAKMATGELQAVISTSALELGIDIGGLDVCILVGYPGTISQTLQRGGRVGRSGRESAVILVAGDDALDQYFMHNPEDFFARPAEMATVNPLNETILKSHLECAAAELPLKLTESWLSAPEAQAAATELEAQGLLLRTADGKHLIGSRKAPHRGVNIRGCGHTFSLEDERGVIIGQIDGYRAWREAHPGAIYIHAGRSYMAEDIDMGRALVRLKRTREKWFTRVRVVKETTILEERKRLSLGRVAVCCGRLRITEQITGYERRSTFNNQLLNFVPLDAPLQTFETEGLWYIIPDIIRQTLEAEFLHFMGSIHALEHAVIGLLPLEVMADRNDFGGISIPLHSQLALPAVFIYDGAAGGAGLTASAFPVARRMLEAVQKAVTLCPCEDGCPGCIQSPKCGAGNRPLSKEGVLRLLGELLAPGQEGEDICKNLQIMPPAVDPDTSVGEVPLADVPGKEPKVSPKAFPRPALVHARKARRRQTGVEEPEQLLTVAESGIADQPPPHYAVFDVETRYGASEVGGWHRAHKMGVSVAVLYDSLNDEFLSYAQDELEDMFARMASVQLIIGFNTLRFDYQVLQPFANGRNFRQWPNLDILAHIHKRLNYRVSMDNLAQATLGAAKSSDGLQALKWWKEGKIEEITRYCLQDVALTRDLYLYGLRHGYLLFTNKAGQRVRAPVDFTVRPDS